MTSSFEFPVHLSDIETVLAWVDTFKLSRPTKKINRDFSDAVLLAEILSVHYPKLVEMHNYPPRNSHSLKLNNWMTLNRKVLKKLKLNLCCNTMEQLANCAPGAIERVLVMVRDKIRRDEEANKSTTDPNLSSGGSYYEAVGDEDNVLVVPIKTRVNGVLETVQQKVVSYESHLTLKEELKDAKDSADVLKQKVEHLDNLLKLKDERIEELQKQLERKQARRKEAETFQNSLQVPFETIASPVAPNIIESAPIPLHNAVTCPLIKNASIKSIEANKTQKEESKIPIKFDSNIKPTLCKPLDTESNKNIAESLNVILAKPIVTEIIVKTFEDNCDSHKVTPTPSSCIKSEANLNVDRIKSDVFKDVDDADPHDAEEFKDSVQDSVTTIEQSIQREIKNINIPIEFVQEMNN